MDILAGLNPKQREATEVLSGPVLVVAGPGSGKTKTLTHRIAYLVANGVPPHTILAVTFTNKAAEEMKFRVAKLLETSSLSQRSTLKGLPRTKSRGQLFITGHGPVIGTFHSVCARILRREADAIGYGPDFTIYDEEDSFGLVKRVMQDLSIDAKQRSPGSIRAAISSLKNEMILPKDHEAESDGPYQRVVLKIYPKYQEQLKKQNAMDFDDLLVKIVELFTENPNVLAKYQRQFQYVLVDEFQDTNPVQYKIANLLVKKHANLYCIGDLDQSIYSFRGADYRNILYFERDWPEAKVITLEQNYRSTQNILDAAHGIISVNTKRKEKPLWTKNGAGERITIKEVEDERTEGEFIVSEIERLVRAKAPLKLKDFVVLYRTNAQSRAIEESFLRAGFPYKIIGGIRFFQRKEVKDILAWLRLSLNAQDEMAWNRVAGIPTKFLMINYQLPVTKQKPKSKDEIITALTENFAKKSKEMRLTDFLEHVIHATGFEKYVRDGTEKGEERWENVQELLSVCVKYDDQEPRAAVRSLLTEAALAQEADNVEYEKDLVNLMTLHAVKGLEFPVVFIAGCEQGLLPHARSLFAAGEDELEEERRLCYVGVTRAKEKLYFLFAQQRMLFGRIQSNPPSEFFQDVPERVITFVPAEEERVIELD